MKLYHKMIDGKDVISPCKSIKLESGGWISNPSEEQIFAEGWEEYTPPTPPPYIPTREEKIHNEIRERYTENDEFMITRQYLANPDNPAYKVAFEEYNAFVEEVLAKYPEENE